MPKSNIQSLLDSNDGVLPSYAWPGGYQIIYLDKDNCALCPACANADLGSVKSWEIYYEGPTTPCDECNCMIESAYGDPDSES